MRITGFAFIALLALPLGACAAQPLGTPLSAVAPEAMAVAKKALISAHGLHQAAAEALTLAANSNLCTGKCAVTARDYLDRSYAALALADGLVAVGDAKGVDAQIQSSISLIYQIRTLTGK
jgi:hypothetical protein